MGDGISRRDLLKFGGIAGAAAAAATVLPGCSSPTNATQATAGKQPKDGLETSWAAGHRRTGMPSFLEAPDPITDIKEVREYDVVVIGAGSPGLPCALAAREQGASVAVLQKQPTASAYGNSGSGIDLTKSDSADIANLIGVLMADSQHRANRKLLEMWAYNSGEAVAWTIDRAQKGGAQVIDQGNLQHMPMINKHGYTMTFVTSFFGPKPYYTGPGMVALANYAESQGVEIFYNTPARQLVKEGNRVIGVIAQNLAGEYIQFNGKNGVVVATGDYQNDREMLEYYLPDLRYLEPKQSGRTGDGHKMVVWAGGAIEKTGHTKMMHDFDAGPASMCDMPFMRVKMDGTRFCNETVEMSLMNCYLQSPEDAGNYCDIYDSAYMTKGAAFPGKLVDPESLRHYMPEEDVSPREGVFEGFIATYKANTLDELAAKLGITNPEQLKATVQRWNAFCVAGSDPDFGLDPAYLKTIDRAPYYGCHRHVRFSEICSGVKVNDELQCLTPEGKVIDGLYAIGNVAGGFYGGVDYPLTVFGLNLGHNYTQGYVIGKKLGAM